MRSSSVELDLDLADGTSEEVDVGRETEAEEFGVEAVEGRQEGQGDFRRKQCQLIGLAAVIERSSSPRRRMYSNTRMKSITESPTGSLPWSLRGRGTQLGSHNPLGAPCFPSLTMTTLVAECREEVVAA